MKVTLLLPLLAAALATPTRYSSVWPPRVHRPYFVPSYAPATYDTTYDTTSSYATVPTSSFVSGSKRSSSASHPASFSFLSTPRRPSVPSFALAKAKEAHPTYAPARSYGYAPAKKPTRPHPPIWSPPPISQVLSTAERLRVSGVPER
ncbi:hypothetical protein C7M84_022764 [Penaeus vannamei]|uniref:Uncharacterized protein n=1 Tax=Penaeus vannamei TaxID=6689 RepID=A0A3R7MJ46_PENVA|nr:hypothetical protein C7M84_022764 [Penaeus vannamei]